MTVEQQSGNLREQLVELGYQPAEVESVIIAGVDNINQAVDFINSKAPMQDAANFPALPNTKASPSSTSSQPSHNTGNQIRRARDSLDGLYADHQQPVSSNPSTSDLLLRKDSDMKLAMELSLQEKENQEIKTAVERSKLEGQPSRQDQGDDDPDMIRALQESLKDSSQLGTQDRLVTFEQQGCGDSIEQPRKTPDDPVGLRNIGNTCYLNSLLQVYYHLPEFRRAIMSFRPPHDFEPMLQPDTTYTQPPITSQHLTVTEQPTKKFDDVDSEERLDQHISNSQLEQSFGDGFTSSEPTRVLEGPHDIIEEDSYQLPPEDAKEKQKFSVATNATRFVIELQKLFAAMALSTSSCVDPSGVVHTMRNSNGDPILIGAQQDAYEFNHLFLDIVEKGLSGPSTFQGLEEEKTNEKSKPDAQGMQGEMGESEDPGNIIKDLFTLRFRQELCQDKSSGSTDVMAKATFREGETSEIVVNATAKEYRSLHSGLDDYAFARIEYEMSESSEAIASALNPACVGSTEVPDATIGEPSTSATKSVWFTRLPPVVVIYLQRITYNKDISQAEKTNDPYDFPCEISFDRYLDENKAESMRARMAVQRIHRERERLNSMLKRYNNFTSFQNGDGLVDMDISERTSFQGRGPKDFQQAANTQLHTELSEGKSDTESQNIFRAINAVQCRLLESLNSSSELFAVDGLSRSEVEASLDILRRIAEHDQNKYEALQSKMQHLDEEEEKAYKAIERELYRLHAVLVHDGGPSGGHYWTFIRNWNAHDEKLSWMKLSDSVVTFVSEADVLSWSVGGRSRASAYCLIYAAESSLQDKYKNGGSISEESKDLLPLDRIEEVTRASKQFSTHEQKVPDT